MTSGLFALITILAIVVGVVLAFGLYMSPTLMAFDRDHPQRWAIGALNFFLGWTLLGWAGSWVWVLSSTKYMRQHPGFQHAHSWQYGRDNFGDWRRCDCGQWERPQEQQVQSTPTDQRESRVWSDS
jgi:hypothetical protein